MREAYWYEHFSSGVKAHRGHVRICKRQADSSYIVVAELFNTDGKAEDRAIATCVALNEASLRSAVEEARRIRMGTDPNKARVYNLREEE